MTTPPDSDASRPRDAVRTCPRCSARVEAERFESGAVRTWLWRCGCGWSRAVAESGVMTRKAVQDAIASAREDD